jgi:cyclophilin family peptidyl-prolyl cis-trans isomerase
MDVVDKIAELETTIVGQTQQQANPEEARILSVKIEKR